MIIDILEVETDEPVENKESCCTKIITILLCFIFELFIWKKKKKFSKNLLSDDWQSKRKMKTFYREKTEMCKRILSMTAKMC